MKVTIGAFNLAHHDIKSTVEGHNASVIRTTAVDNFRIQGARAAQIAEFLRAKQVKVFDRGNRRTTITFDVTREHKSIRDCEAWMLKHITDVPNKGLVVLEAKADSGALTQRYLKDAICEVVESTYLGVTSRHTYQIIGGDILAEKPKL